jgi:LPS-assembly protein
MAFRFRHIFVLCFLLWLTASASAQSIPVPPAPPSPPPPEPREPVISVEPARPAPKPQETKDPQAPPPPVTQIDADQQRREGDILYADGYVNIVYAGARLQADHVVFNQRTGDALAEGNVIYDPAENQRITARRAELNVRAKTGVFFNASGYTDQTADGGLLEFVADRVDRTAPDTYVLYNAKATACCEDVNPLWSITSKRARIKVGDRLSARNAAFRVKGIPIIPFPLIALPINRRDRQSGVLPPTTGNSTNLGRVVTGFYYQTLGDSADVTFQGDVYSARGIGFGTTFRAALAEDSYIRIGTYTVADRIFGQKKGPGVPDQGGTLFFAKAVNHFGNGFVGVADINYTTSFDFRAVFGNTFQDAFNPESKVVLHLSKVTPTFAARFLLENRTTRINVPQANGATTAVEINIRKSPSIQFDFLPTRIKDTPIYLSGEASFTGLRREERIVNTNQLTFETPTFLQRLDSSPRLTAVLPEFAGWSVTPSLGLRTTYYSASFDPLTAITPRPALALGLPLPPTSVPAGSRLGTVGSSVFRNLVDFSLDIRPPSFGRTFYGKDGKPRFKHIIESAVIYRRIAGVNDPQRIVRFDSVDAFSETNEIEYSLTNRLLVPSNDGGDPEHPQARELLSLTISQKYFFDPTFGGALLPGQRNQLVPILTLSGFSYGGVGRNVSPLNFKLRVTPLKYYFADLRLDFDTKVGQVRGFGFTGGIYRQRFQLSQTWYYSQQLMLKNGQPEPGTFDGNLTSTNLELGDPNRGLHGGVSVGFDFARAINQTNLRNERRGLIFTSFTLGYAFRCAALQLNYSSVNLGVASAGRLTFSFSLRGLGTFGNQQFNPNISGARIRNF